MPTDKKRDVAAEIRAKAIEYNKKKKKKSAPKEPEQTAFGKALAKALDIFKIGQTTKKAAER